MASVTISARSLVLAPTCKAKSRSIEPTPIRPAFRSSWAGVAETLSGLAFFAILGCGVWHVGLLLERMVGSCEAALMTGPF